MGYLGQRRMYGTTWIRHLVCRSHERINKKTNNSIPRLRQSSLLFLSSRATPLLHVREAGGKRDRNRRTQYTEPEEFCEPIDAGLDLIYRVRRLNKNTPGVFRRASLTRDYSRQIGPRSLPLHPQHNLRYTRSRSRTPHPQHNFWGPGSLHHR